MMVRVRWGRGWACHVGNNFGGGEQGWQSGRVGSDQIWQNSNINSKFLSIPEPDLNPKNTRNLKFKFNPMNFWIEFGYTRYPKYFWIEFGYTRNLIHDTRKSKNSKIKITILEQVYRTLNL